VEGVVRRAVAGDLAVHAGAPGLRVRLGLEDQRAGTFGELVGFITSGPVVVARLEGEGAIDVWRTMMGPTDPATAPPGTIRGDYGLIITENLVHGSDSPDSAERELKLFFG
jgi:nucleoside-diphosphate kinase